MIDPAPELVRAFKSENVTLVPANIANSKTALPCITFHESGNAVQSSGDTLEYSDLSYTLEAWGNDHTSIKALAAKADKIMRKLGWKRTFSNEQWINGLGRKILKYSATGVEELED